METWLRAVHFEEVLRADKISKGAPVPSKEVIRITLGDHIKNSILLGGHSGDVEGAQGLLIGRPLFFPRFFL